MNPPLDFRPPGEETLVATKKARAIFLTWGSEVEDDERSGNLHKKDWLIAPVFPLEDLKNFSFRDERTGRTILMQEAIRERKSPRFFPLESFPGEQGSGFYVDLRKICCLAATHLQREPRKWRLAPLVLDLFYHHLIWFFTRKKIFLGPVPCPKCGEAVDLGVTFEGQPLEPDF